MRGTGKRGRDTGQVSWVGGKEGEEGEKERFLLLNS